MKKGKLKNVLKNLMLSLMVIIPSVVFATTTYEKGDIIDPTHFESTDSNCTSINCELTNEGDIAFEKTVSKTNENGIYEIALKVKGKDVTKTVEGNTHDIYIAVVLDISGSMIMPSKIKYENAVAGAKYFSEKVLEKNDNAKLALITFDANVNLARNFDNKAFIDNDFPSTGRGTNLKDAIEDANELLKAKDNENAELYMVVIGDGLPNDVNGAISKAETAKKDDIEIFSVGYVLDNNGKDCLKKVAGFKDGENIYNAYNNEAKDYFVEAQVDTILRKFDKIAKKITKTFSAGTDVTIKDVLGDKFTYIENSANLEYTYNNKDYKESITPTINGKELSFKIDEVMEITQTIKFKVKIDETTLENWNRTNGSEGNTSASITYTDADGKNNQSLTITDSAKVYWTQPKYIINYYKDSVNGEFLGKVEDYALIDDVITADTTEFLPDGYKYEGTAPSMTIKENDNVLNVVYIKDLSQIKTLTYTVEYYKDDVLVDTEPYSETVWAGSDNNITIDVNSINTTNKYVGYKFDSSNPATIPTSVETGTTIKIYYVKDVTETKELSYTVEYYKDNVLEETKTDKEVVWINDDEIINVDFDLINTTNKYVGYKFDSSNPTTIPTSVETGTTIKIYYVKDESITKELNYNLKYFTVNGEEITEMDSYNLTESVWINDSNYIIVKPIDKSNDRYTGYKYGYTNPETITTKVLSGSTISVYYVKDLTQTKTLNYTVKFYIDNEEVVEDRIEKEKIVWVNDPYVIDVEEFDMSEDKYYGYKLITAPDTIPTSVETGSIINIYYEKDETQTKELTYTVKYFKDEVEVEEDEIIVTKEVWVNDSDLIEIDEFDFSDDKYTGYSFESINPEDLEDTIKTGSIIEVHYVINYYEYEVNYYKDSISEDNLIDSINDEAKYGEIIEIEELLNLPKGYTYNGEEVELVIDVENNVINIVYEKDRFEYTVEYYYDGKLDEDKTDVIKVLYGTEITEVEDKSYDNYILSKTENLPLVIEEKNNIIKVYYVESGIGGDIIEPPKTGNSNNYLNILLVLISLIIIKIKNI